MNNFISRLSIVALLAALMACAPTPTSRATGQVVDDATLTARVKTELAKTEGLGEAISINVDTYRGVVSLSGFVDNDQARQSAVNAARRVEGVSEVRNNLQIKPRN